MMRRAGRVTGIAQGVAVLRAEGDEVPEIGETVVDDRLDEVGTVVDVFGPVGRPYVAVSPTEGIDSPGLLSSVLYVR